MKRLAILLYGVVVYLLFFATFLHAIFFVEGVLVPRTLSAGGIVGPTATALLVNLGLLSLFAVQHNVMARPWFKKRWTRIVHPAIERSTFVLATITILNAMIFFWRPLPAVVWEVGGPAASVLTALSWAGWGLVLVATFVIDHFELFGLKQPIQHFRGIPPTKPAFQVRYFYRWTRHPLYLGFFVAFWSTPVMTVSHLLFAGVVTTWVLIAVRFEEHDLVAEHGEAYREYRRRVPMILPLGRRAAPVLPGTVRRSDSVGA
jgi:protein-S-isoprenylcysteine O-methyltransferase Ste14